VFFLASRRKIQGQQKHNLFKGKLAHPTGVHEIPRRGREENTNPRTGSGLISGSGISTGEKLFFPGFFVQNFPEF